MNKTANWRAIARQVWIEKQIRTTTWLNGLFFFFRRLPIVGKTISPNLYREYELKKGLFWIAFVGLTVFNVLLNAALVFGLSVFGGVIISALFKHVAASQLLRTGFFAWFEMIPFFGFISGLSNKLSKGQLEYARNFGLSPRAYLKNMLLANRLLNVFLYVPGFFAFAIVTGQIGMTATGLVSLLFFYLLGLLLNRKLFQWHIKKTDLIIVILAVIWGLVQTPLVLLGWGLRINPIVGNLGTALVLLVGTAIVAHRLLHFKFENEYLLNQIDSTNISLGKAAKAQSKQYLGQGMAMQSKMTVTDESGLANRYQGNQYLNALLFKRYQPELVRGMKRRGFGLLLAIVIALVAGVVFRGKFSKHDVSLVSTMSLPFLFFVFYILGYGKKIAQMVFLNCDVAMLNYPFYREPKAIIQGFMYRFKMTAAYNAVIAVAVFLIYFVFGIANGRLLGPAFFGVLLLLLVALTLLFSFHELFVYYMLQPFTSDLTVKNPLYKLVSGALYWVSYANTRLNFKGLTYSLIISLVVFVYVGIGLFFLYKKAPQTFKLK